MLEIFRLGLPCIYSLNYQLMHKENLSQVQYMYMYPNIPHSNVVASTSLKIEMNDMKKLLRTFSNEIINIKNNKKCLQDHHFKIIRAEGLHTNKTRIIEEKRKILKLNPITRSYQFLLHCKPSLQIKIGSW